AAVSVNTARPINTAYPRPTVNSVRPVLNVFNRAHSHDRRPFNKFTINKNSNFNEKVNTIRGNVTTVGPKAVGNPQQDLKDIGVIDSRCSRHMIGNKSYLTYYEEIGGGFVSFGGNSKGGKITGKDFKLTDESLISAVHVFQVTPKVLHLHAVKRIFRYLKGQPKLGLWYPKDSPFNLEAYTDSDYAGASLDKKSITGGCQFLGSRLISWQCKKQTMVANSTTEAEYIIHKGWLKWNATSAEDGIEVKTEESQEVRKEENVKNSTTQEEGRNEIDQDEGISWFQEDAKTQGRYGHDTKINTTSTSITTASINITTAKPVITVSAPIVTAGVSVSTVELSTPPTTTTTIIEDEDLTIAQTLMKMRTSETTTRPIVPTQQQLDPKDKGKGIMQEPKKPVKAKGKDQIEYDADIAKRLQAELDEVRLEREREKEKEASYAAFIEEWDTIKARIYADAQLAKRVQAEEREQMSVEERARLVMEFIAARKKFFAAKRAKEQRNKPPTKAEQRKKLSYKQVNDFVPMDTESSRKKAVSKKRAGERPSKESAKRQKIEDDAEKAELKACLEIVPGDDSAINIESLATKYPIVDRKTHILAEDKMLVKERFESTSLEGYERLLCEDLITLFEPSKEDEIWKAQQDYTLISWRLYDSCGVHLLLMDTGITIHMLAEKKYPLTQEMLSKMLSKRLEVDQKWHLSSSDLSSHSTRSRKMFGYILLRFKKILFKKLDD
ncbi:hypothetical protein Tco_0575074, partial [Tanacetum coccineum]